MTGTTATADGREPSAVRRSWLPRTVAAFFLGAGVYAGLAVGTDVIAHADEPAATTQAAEAPPEGAQPAAATPPDDAAPADAAEPAPDGASATASSTATITSTTTTVATSTTGAATTTVTTAGDATSTVTTGSGDTTDTAESQTTSTTSGTTTTVTTTTTTGDGTVTTRDTIAVDTAGETQDSSATPPAAEPAVASDTVITEAQGTLCEPASAPEARAGGPAGGNHPSSAHSSGTLGHGSATSVALAGSSEAPALITSSSTQAPDSAPGAPETPLQLPAPTTAFGLSGCGGPGAGQGSPKGASAPAAAGVLGTPLEISHAVNDPAPTAPAAGSTATTAIDPGTRPD
jgi:hypothetical protein